MIIAIAFSFDMQLVVIFAGFAVNRIKLRAFRYMLLKWHKEI